MSRKNRGKATGLRVLEKASTGPHLKKEGQEVNHLNRSISPSSPRLAPTSGSPHLPHCFRQPAQGRDGCCHRTSHCNLGSVMPGAPGTEPGAVQGARPRKGRRGAMGERRQMQGEGQAQGCSSEIREKASLQLSSCLYCVFQQIQPKLTEIRIEVRPRAGKGLRVKVNQTWALPSGSSQPTASCRMGAFHAI